MNAELYKRVVAQWCEATGMPPWRPDEEMHVEVDDATVGLVYDEAGMPERLHVFVDMGSFFDTGLHSHLLELNMAVGWSDGGCFALHGDHVVYHSTVPLGESMDGIDFAALVSGVVGNARARMMS